MDNNIYKILGLPNTASQQEIEDAYTILNAKLSEDRFKSGFEGNDAARALNDLNVEYRMYKEELARKKQGGYSGYDNIDELIKNGKLDAAQELLDGIMDRNGEWHYMQSIVFYKRDWLSECRKHLVMAINLEPTNSKYKSALDKLDMVIGNGKVNPQQFGNQNRYNGNNQYARGQQDALCNCLLTYCIIQACCGPRAGC